MKNIIIATILLFLFNACTSSVQPQLNQTSVENSLTIDIDEEISILNSLGSLRNEKNTILDNPIYIGDNDEVSFKGDFLEKNSPISIKIGTKQPIVFHGKHYRIKSSKINHGEIIQMRDKNGNIFLDMEVIKN